MVTLESYACGEWKKGSGKPRVLRNAVTGEPIAEISSEGIDFGAMLRFGRERGGAALRKMTFPERAAVLKKMAGALNERGDELRAIAASYGATPKDARLDVDGGIGTLAFYASLGAKQLPESRILADGEPSPLSKGGNFVGRHVYVPLEGVAVQINAYNFPSWGMLEKLAPGLSRRHAERREARDPHRLAHVPDGADPDRFRRRSRRNPSAHLGLGRRSVLSPHVPGRGLVHRLRLDGREDPVSPHDREKRGAREHRSRLAQLRSPRSGRGARLPDFEHFKNEVMSEMTVKAGQKCTAIRRVLVPEARAQDVIRELRESLRAVKVGNPAGEGVSMGPLVDEDALASARDGIEKLEGRSGGCRWRPRPARLRAEGRLLHGARASPLPQSEERAERFMRSRSSVRSRRS